MAWEWQSLWRRTYPEIRHLSKFEQSELLSRSRGRVRLRLRRHRPAHLIAAGFTLVGFVLFLRAVESPDVLRRVPGWLAPTAAAIVWVVVFRLGVRNDRRWRRALRDELLRHDIRPAVCFGCGYDLRHAGAGVCPECGERIGKNPSMFNPPPPGDIG